MLYVAQYERMKGRFVSIFSIRNFSFDFSILTPRPVEHLLRHPERRLSRGIIQVGRHEVLHVPDDTAEGALEGGGVEHEGGQVGAGDVEAELDQLNRA